MKSTRDEVLAALITVYKIGVVDGAQGNLEDIPMDYLNKILIRLGMGWI